MDRSADARRAARAKTGRRVFDDGLSLDDGGSTTMTVLGRIRNRVSDPVERPVANALVARYRPDIAIRNTATTACPTDRVPDRGFADVADTTHEATIACAAWHGITTGVTSMRYGPGRDVTRAQMASFLARLVDHVATHPAPPQGAVPCRRAQARRSTTCRRGLPMRRRSTAWPPPASSPAGPRPAGVALRSRPDRDPCADGVTARPHRHMDPARRTAGRPQRLRRRRGQRARGRGQPAGPRRHRPGPSPGLFAPGGPVRRGQMASFLLRTVEVLAAGGTTAPPT